MVVRIIIIKTNIYYLLLIDNLLVKYLGSVYVLIFVAVTDVQLTQENCIRCIRVGRGRDWTGTDEDHHNGKPGLGTITNCTHSSLGNMWAWVKWDNGKDGINSIGDGGKFDLNLAREQGK